MNVIEAIILGIIQGLTEFLPISSSGHLILAENLFGVGNGSLLFDVSLHSGTLLALVIYFARDIAHLISGFFNSTKDKLWSYLLIGTIPAAAVGWLLQDLAEDTFRSSWLVAFNLIWVGLVMLWVDKIGSRRSIKEVNSADAWWVGLAQALALVPGVSRSGITIVAGRLRGFNSAAAARFSFLLAIPVTFGAVIKLLVDNGAATLAEHWGAYLAGVLSAGLVGYLAIDFLLKFLSRHKLAPFAYYRLGLGGLLVLALMLGWL